MSDDAKVMRSVYIPRELDSKIKQIAFKNGQTFSQNLMSFALAGMAAFEAESDFTDRHMSHADQAEERSRLVIKHREAKIAELIKEIDDEFDVRWEKIKAAIRSVYEAEKSEPAE